MDSARQANLNAAIALERLDRTCPTTTWMTPRDLKTHREELTRRLVTGDDTPYGLPFIFPDVDVASVHSAAGEAREMASILAEPFRTLVLSEIDDTVEHVEVIASRSDERLRGWALRRRPIPELVAEAERLLASLVVEPEEGTVPAHRVASMLETALANYELEEWQVVVMPNMGAKASVRHASREMRIRADATFSEAGARRIVVHEFGGHVLRWVNAEAQAEPLAARPLGDSAPTEEGLAVFLEEQLGVSTNATLHTYAMRVVAVDAAQRTGLVDLARLLTRYAAPKVAAEMALRVRRGFGNPEFPGGLTRDAGYLKGLLACWELAASSPADLDLMRGHKWPLDYLPLARDLAEAGLLAPPALLPDLERLGMAEV